MVGSFDNWESYFYPETFDPVTKSGTLRNLFDERDVGTLGRLEYVETSARAAELRLRPALIRHTYDAAHVRAIHRYLFQDVFEWAGEYRTVNTSKGPNEFADVRGGIDSYLADVHRLVTERDWAGLDHAEFSAAAAAVLAYLNQAHPFREGNGRTAKIFLAHVAERSAFALDYALVTPLEWNNASMLSAPDRGAYRPVPDSLVPVISRIAAPRSGGLRG